MKTMNMKNLTKCETRAMRCLAGNLCCYECEFKGWCEGRCDNQECRHMMIKRRLNYVEDTLEKAN